MGKWKETLGEGFGTGRLNGSTRKTQVQDQEKGGTAGYHVEHWDGSQDAVAQPKAVKLKVKGE